MMQCSYNFSEVRKIVIEVLVIYIVKFIFLKFCKILWEWVWCGIYFFFVFLRVYKLKGWFRE